MKQIHPKEISRKIFLKRNVQLASLGEVWSLSALLWSFGFISQLISNE